LISVIAGALCLGPGLAAAKVKAPHLKMGRMEIKLGHSKLVDLPAATKRVSVGDEKTADVVMTTARQLYVNARGLGTTNILVG
jgi:Flp pilus assembly secretin CpaC